MISFLVAAWFAHVLSNRSFRHLRIATWSKSRVHLLVSVLVFLLLGERVRMRTALVHHQLELVDKPSLAATLIALNWLVPAFELLATLNDIWRRYKHWLTVC